MKYVTIVDNTDTEVEPRHRIDDLTQWMHDKTIEACKVTAELWNMENPGHDFKEKVIDEPAE